MESAGPDDIALLTAYCDAAMRRDADAATAGYTTPVAFITTRGTRTLATDDELRSSIAAAYAHYDTLGITQVAFTSGRAIALNDHLRHLEARWVARRADDTIAVDVTTWYVLRRTDAGWRIAAVINTG
jgi:hypothetical protein